MNDIHGPLIYEGKAKIIYASANSKEVLVEFKNDATAFNAKKHSKIDGKGRLNCLISVALFNLLEGQGINTHFIEQKSDTAILAKKVQIIPIEVVMRNVATGSLCRQTPIQQGTELKPPLLDLYYKSDELGDPILTEDRLKLLNLVEPSQMEEIEKITRKVNLILTDYFAGLDLLLVDFKLEFGFDPTGKLILADEISPDNCRLWDKRKSDAKDRILDKDRFRQDLGGVIDAYAEILKRIQENSSKVP